MYEFCQPSENTGDVSILTKPFCANITSVSCLAYIQQLGEYYWDKAKCEVTIVYIVASKRCV